MRVTSPAFPGLGGAGNSFSDDFSTLDTTFWNPIPNDGGSIKIENNQFLTLSAEYGYSFPYLLLKNYVFPDKDYSIKDAERVKKDLISYIKSYRLFR